LAGAERLRDLIRRHFDIAHVRLFVLAERGRNADNDDVSFLEPGIIRRGFKKARFGETLDPLAEFDSLSIMGYQPEFSSCSQA